MGFGWAMLMGLHVGSFLKVGLLTEPAVSQWKH